MSIKNTFGSLAVSLSLLTASQADAFFGFGDCWTNTDGIKDEISCWNWSGSVDVTGGYRSDRITCLIDAFDPPGTFISSDDLKAKNLSVWEWGLKGRLQLGNFYTKAWGTFGIIPSGNYSELGTGADGGTSHTKGLIRHGKVEDASFGLGYLFNVCDWLCFAPIGGWAYDYQRVKVRNAHTDGVSDPIINGLSYTNRWQGPWVGFDSGMVVDCIAINVGYEYHWAHWHAVWKLSGDDVVGGAFSDKRHSNNASGNVVYLNTFWNAWDDLEAGLLLKYQYWRAKNGQMLPLAGSFAAVGFGADEVDKIPHAVWQSIEIQLSLGYAF